MYICVYFVEVSRNQRGGATLSLTEHLGSTQNNAHRAHQNKRAGANYSSLLDLNCNSLGTAADYSVQRRMWQCGMRRVLSKRTWI